MIKIYTFSICRINISLYSLVLTVQKLVSHNFQFIRFFSTYFLTFGMTHNYLVVKKIVFSARFSYTPEHLDSYSSFCVFYSSSSFVTFSIQIIVFIFVCLKKTLWTQLLERKETFFCSPRLTSTQHDTSGIYLYQILL